MLRIQQALKDNLSAAQTLRRNLPPLNVIACGKSAVADSKGVRGFSQIYLTGNFI